MRRLAFGLGIGFVLLVLAAKPTHTHAVDYMFVIDTDAHACTFTNTDFGDNTFSGDEVRVYGFDIGDEYVQAGCVTDGRFASVDSGWCLIRREGVDYPVFGVSWREPEFRIGNRIITKARTFVWCSGIR